MNGDKFTRRQLFVWGIVIGAAGMIVFGAVGWLSFSSSRIASAIEALSTLTGLLIAVIGLVIMTRVRDP